jgi:hypothetical protein
MWSFQTPNRWETEEIFHSHPTENVKKWLEA